MENLTQRCTAVAAAALATGGLMAALTSMTQPLDDLQIRDFDLAAARSIDSNPVVETIENHLRPDLSGTGETQDINLADLLFGRGDGELGSGSTSFGDLSLDEDVANVLAGGGLGPQVLQGIAAAIEPIDMGVIGSSVPTAGLFGGGTEQAAISASNVAANAVAGIAVAAQGLPAAYDAFTNAVAAVEADLNNSLVAAQTAAAERLFGDSPGANEVVNWIYAVNNTLLADNQAAFNSLFGIPFDSHTSLLGHLDTSMTDADWSVILGFGPGELNNIVDTLQAESMSLLGGIEWAALWDSLF